MSRRTLTKSPPKPILLDHVKGRGGARFYDGFVLLGKRLVILGSGPSLYIGAAKPFGNIPRGDLELNGDVQVNSAAAHRLALWILQEQKAAVQRASEYKESVRRRKGDQP